MYLLPYFQIVPTSSFSNCTYFLIFNMYLLPDLWNVPTSYVVTSWFVKCTYFLCSYFPIAICTYFLCSYFLFYRMFLHPMYLIPSPQWSRPRKFVESADKNKLFMMNLACWNLVNLREKRVKLIRVLKNTIFMSFSIQKIGQFVLFL